MEIIKKLVRPLISKMTKPNQVYICEAGDLWIISCNPHHSINCEYTHHYQAIKQNTWGYWHTETHWLSRYSELKLHSITK